MRWAPSWPASAIGNWAGSISIASTRPWCGWSPRSPWCWPASMRICAGTPTGNRGGPEYQIGDKFIRDHGVEAFWWFTVARWACIPFSLLGGWYCYRWASDLWGGPSGLVAMGMWCVSPSVLAHGQLITTDVAGAAAGLAASYWFCRWIRGPTWRGAAAAGIVFGLASWSRPRGSCSSRYGRWSGWLRCGYSGKAFPARRTPWDGLAIRPTTWGNLSPSRYTAREGLADVRSTGSSRNPGEEPPKGGTTNGAFPAARSINRQAAQLAAILALGLYVINLGYGFEGSFKRLGAYTFVSRPLAGADSWTEWAHGGNRFKDGWLGLVPLPLPYNYVQGLDRQKWELEDKQDSYLRGEWRKQGWWYYYLYGLGIKEPLGTWLLLGLSAVVALRRAWLVDSADKLLLVATPCVVLLVASSQTGMSHHVRYAIPVLPFVFVLAGGFVGGLPRGDWKLAVCARHCRLVGGQQPVGLPAQLVVLQRVGRRAVERLRAPGEQQRRVGKDPVLETLAGRSSGGGAAGSP